MANHLVQTRIDGQIKDEAAAVLAGIGMTVSQAVRLMLTRVAQEKRLPFDPMTAPSDETLNALKEARSGTLKRYTETNEMLNDLNA
ncbi:type II toxin-antitoxin system RelB/DinJ family antitoxin [Stenoxybacter acetivorans]|uniref:type II toxin-antitoxin system RelB/DinJ family antitoxin n=1 Tax=Stenoxybacter acetivorans TaxID=422441 RepID=UPI000B2DC4DD|nr:type II toxin-antitoxin system RelB/DinJ family antitoxin [Stenoxybacter acetivorans]